MVKLGGTSIIGGVQAQLVPCKALSQGDDLADGDDADDEHDEHNDTVLDGSHRGHDSDASLPQLGASWWLLDEPLSRSRTRPLISTVHACVWHGDGDGDRVVINVELPALCSPQFRPGKPSELQQSLCHRINTLAKAYAAAPRPCSISTRINVDLVASDWIGLALDRLWLVSLQSQATGYGRALCA